MHRDQQYELVRWDELYGLCLELADRISASGLKFDAILGISRGGLVPSRVLSDELENPNIIVVRVEFYTDIYKVKAEPRVVHVPDLDLKGKDVLVVDDVADSGRSLECISRLLKEEDAKTIRIATVFYKPWSSVVPDFYVRTTDKWVVFPHENHEAILAIAKKMGAIPADEMKGRLTEIGFEPALVDRALRRLTS